MIKRFWILTTAAALSKIGNRFLYLAVPWAVLQSTNSPFLAVFSIGIQSIPYIVAPILGSLIDKYDRRLLFFYSEILQALSVGIIPWFIASDQIYAIFLSLLVLGLGSVVSGITSDYSLIPSLIPREKLDWAYSRYSTILQIARFMGPAMAGLVIGLFGTSWALWIDAMTFLVTAIAALFLPKMAKQENHSQNIFHLLKDGIYSFWECPEVKKLTVVLTIYNLGMGGVLAIMVAIANQSWNWSVELVGMILSGGSVTGALGAWATVYLFKSQGMERRILYWLSICAIGTLALLLPAPLLIVFGFYVLSFGEGGMNVDTMTYRQKIIEDKFSGRINSIIRMFVVGSIPISSLLLGYMIHSFDYFLSFLLVAVTSLVASFIWWKWSLESTQIFNESLSRS